jgi:hypothetical protein
VRLLATLLRALDAAAVAAALSNTLGAGFVAAVLNAVRRAFDLIVTARLMREDSTGVMCVRRRRQRRWAEPWRRPQSRWPTRLYGSPPLRHRLAVRAMLRRHRRWCRHFGHLRRRAVMSGWLRQWLSLRRKGQISI